MKRLLIILCCLLGFSGFSQGSLAIDLYRLGHFRRLHVYEHQMITLKLKDSRYTYRDTLVGFGDSAIVLASIGAVKLNEIRSIKIDRSNWLLRKLYRTGIVGGIFIVVIDAANNIGNVRPTVVDNSFLIVGSSMVAGGLILKFFCTRHVHPGKNTRLKIIDLSLK